MTPFNSHLTAEKTPLGVPTSDNIIDGEIATKLRKQTRMWQPVLE